jgi:hypothetical protein
MRVSGWAVAMPPTHCARAQSFAIEGAWSCAQLIEPSAVALSAAVRDHFRKLIVGPQKQKPAERGSHARAAEESNPTAGATW